MRISDWSSDVCSSDLPYAAIPYIGDELNEKIASLRADPQIGVILFQRPYFANRDDACGPSLGTAEDRDAWWLGRTADFEPPFVSDQAHEAAETRSEEHTSELQSLMRISYAVFCLKKKNTKRTKQYKHT